MLPYALENSYLQRCLRIVFVIIIYGGETQSKPHYSIIK